MGGAEVGAHINVYCVKIETSTKKVCFTASHERGLQAKMNACEFLKLKTIVQPECSQKICQWHGKFHNSYKKAKGWAFLGIYAQLHVGTTQPATIVNELSGTVSSSCLISSQKISVILFLQGCRICYRLCKDSPQKSKSGGLYSNIDPVWVWSLLVIVLMAPNQRIAFFLLFFQ